MKTRAVRLYGKNDLRCEEFDLPEIGHEEILAEVVSDSICMSSYKAAMQGSEHKRVPNDVSDKPIIIGHEFCGKIVQVGSKWENKYKVGEKFSIQPALNISTDPYSAPGYSFAYIGGDATYIIIPDIVIEQNCLLPYSGDAYFYGSLAEPMSCIVGAFHSQYHTVRGEYKHEMGIVEGGKMAILAGAGPMGLGAIDYALNCDRKPSLLVITDIDEERLNRASMIFSKQDAIKSGITLEYVNTSNLENPAEHLLGLSGGIGFDDVFVFAPVEKVVELASDILGYDGCLNFFAGPNNQNFSAKLNYYNVHYNSTHLVGTSGGNTADMLECLDLMGKGVINPAAMITHIGGLNSVVDTTLNLPKIPGGKKLIYTGIEMELTALIDFKKKGETDPLFAKLDAIVYNNKGLWCAEAEDLLLNYKLGKGK